MILGWISCQNIKNVLKLVKYSEVSILRIQKNTIKFNNAAIFNTENSVNLKEVLG